MVNIEQIIDSGEFTLCLCALSYTNDLSIYGLNFCSNHNLCAGNAHDFIPSHILMLLQFQAIFGDAYHPICQYGKIEMRFDTIVALMIDRTDVQVCLQHMESFLYGSDYIIKFLDVQCLAFIKARQQDISVLHFPLKVGVCDVKQKNLLLDAEHLCKCSLLTKIADCL